MSEIPNPRVHARHYFKNPPVLAIAVDEPWWWPVLALGADVINLPFQWTYGVGPVAIVSREQPRWTRRQDVEAIEGILKAEGRPAFDAYSCPHAAGKIVGLVDVVETFEHDKAADSLWWAGPYAIRVERQCLLPIGPSGTLDTHALVISISQQKRDSILYALTAMANGHMQPGAERRR